MIKQTTLAALLVGGVLLLPLQADALKNSLHSILQKKSQTQLVDLSGLDINAKPKPLHPQSLTSRPANTIVAVANGKEIKKSTLDKFLLKASKGKVRDFDLLPPKQKTMLVRQYYLPKYIASQAISQIPKEKRYEIYKAVWMRKKASTIKIKDGDVKKAYDEMLSQAQANNQANLIPAYDNIKDRIKMQLLDDKMTAYILKDAKIEVAEPNPMGIAGNINDEFVSVSDVEPIVRQISRGKATWSRLNPVDKKRILEMVATQKLAQKVALRELSLDEKYNAISNVWLQDKIKDIKVSNKELQKAYKRVKRGYKKGKVPSFEEIKPTLQMEVARDKYMQKLIKHIKVKLK